jgi:Protein of unknown function (DUF1350)
MHTTTAHTVLLQTTPTQANVLVSFNNFAAKDSIPLLSELRGLGAQLGGLTANTAAIKDTAAAFGLASFAPLAERALGIVADFTGGTGGAGFTVPDEFQPSPEATWRLVEQQYSVKNNLVSCTTCSTFAQLSHSLSRCVQHVLCASEEQPRELCGLQYIYTTIIRTVELCTACTLSVMCKCKQCSILLVCV